MVNVQLYDRITIFCLHCFCGNLFVKIKYLFAFFQYGICKLKLPFRDIMPNNNYLEYVRAKSMDMLVVESNHLYCM